MRKSLLLSAVSLIVICSNSFSQTNGNSYSTSFDRDLTGTHSIYINFGFKVNSGTSVNTTVSGVKAETNFTGSLGYQYWFDNQWSVNASIGVFSAKTDVNYTNVNSISIVPLLFGISYYPEALSLGSVGRVHFGVNTGVYIGSGTKTGVSLNNLSNLGTSSVNETVFGVEPNAGIDFFLSRYFKIGPSVSYHYVSEFQEVIGNRKNYSGPVFTIHFGLLL